MKIKQRIKEIKPIKLYLKGKHLEKNPTYIAGKTYLEDRYINLGLTKGEDELKKIPTRTQILNYLLQQLDRECNYLEIGVRFPEDNYNHIEAKNKFSVDPGIENAENPVDFKMTSDVFFDSIANGNILQKDIKFDVIFIDGLHLAHQVDKDIRNSLEYIKDDGFIVMHDCNPPTEWHARETFAFSLSPANVSWNGTTWKAFYKWRCKKEVFSCCIDSDWGVGIISKTQDLGKNTMASNPFFEFHEFNANRKDALNLISFNDLKQLLKK